MGKLYATVEINAVKKKKQLIIIKFIGLLQFYRRTVNNIYVNVSLQVQFELTKHSLRVYPTNSMVYDDFEQISKH